jgi:hypothetical protein
MSRYCLDANILIQAKNGPYGFDFFPAFWDWIDRIVADGAVYSTVSVYDELVAGDDDLSEWVKRRQGEPMFVEPSAEVQARLSQIADFVIGDYEPQHADLFLAGADPWVIAQAAHDGAYVVTHEVMVAPNAKKVKVPNICTQFAVPYMDTYAMMRALGARFS